MKGAAVKIVVVIAVVCAACVQAPDPNDAATWDGGSATVTEVEAVLALQKVQPAADLDGLVEAYRVAAERLVASRIAVAGSGDDQTSAEAESGLDEGLLRREAVLDLFIQRRLLPRAAVTAGQVETFYSENPDVFQRQERRFVSHIYRYNRNLDQPEETIALLNELRERAQSGETFEQLAAEYSDSETRLLGGRLGWIGRGRLPSALEDIVFTLTKDEISDPVPSREGAFLFLVTGAVEAMTYPFDDVKTMIARRLVVVELDQLCSELAEAAPMPDGSLVIETDDLLRRLYEAPDDEIVLSVGPDAVDAAAMRELVDQVSTDEIQWITPGDHVREVYDRGVNRARMLASEEVVAFGDDSDVAEAVEREVRARIRRADDEARIEAFLLERVGEDRAAVEAFYRDNVFLYQTSLEVRLDTLSIPLTAAGKRIMGRLQEYRSQLEDGSSTLEEAAAELGGRVEEIGWLDSAALTALEPKVRTYILDLDGEGYTVPFQLNRELHVVHVVERREPRVLPLDEVLDRVQHDYFSRHQQKIFREWMAEVLAERDYQFHEEAVRRVLERRSAGLSD